jgi:hypothetical protein
MNPLLEDLLDHQAWADAEHWRAIELSAPGREDQAIHDRLHHIHQVQRLFIWAVGERQSEFAFSKPEDFKTFDDLKAYARGSHSEIGHVVHVFAGHKPDDLADRALGIVSAHAGESAGLTFLSFVPNLRLALVNSEAS